MFHVGAALLCAEILCYSRNKLWRAEYLLQFNKPWNETKWIDFWRTFAVFVAAAATVAAVADAQKFHLIKPIMVEKKKKHFVSQTKSFLLLFMRFTVFFLIVGGWCVAVALNFPTDAHTANQPTNQPTNQTI